jgi:hypothetical protein
VPGSPAPTLSAPPVSPPASAEASPSAPPFVSLPADLFWTERNVGAGPSAREDHTWTVDPTGRVAYLFGGRAGDQALDDLWRFDLHADAWTQLTPLGPGPGARFGHVAVWDETAGLIVWSGQQSANLFFDDIWLYDPVDNVWQPLPGNGDKPLARYGSCGSIGPDGALWTSHGFTHDEGRFNDTHSYDLASGRWFDQTPTGQLPVDRCLHDCFWTTAGSLLLYAGQTTGVKALADLWAYDPLTLAWTEQPKPAAPARQLYALAPYGDQAYVLGGGDIDGGYLGDLWRLDVVQLSWTEIALGTEGPAARSAATLIADTQVGRLLMFGGKNADGDFGDLWELIGSGG